MVLALEISGESKIEEIYANTDTKEIIVKGYNLIMNSIKPLYNFIKCGKLNLHIPYRTKIHIENEEPINGDESF